MERSVVLPGDARWGATRGEPVFPFAHATRRSLLPSSFFRRATVARRTLPGRPRAIRNAGAIRLCRRGDRHARLDGLLRHAASRDRSGRGRGHGRNHRASREPPLGQWPGDRCRCLLHGRYRGLGDKPARTGTDRGDSSRDGFRRVGAPVFSWRGAERIHDESLGKLYARDRSRPRRSRAGAGLRVASCRLSATFPVFQPVDDDADFVAAAQSACRSTALGSGRLRADAVSRRSRAAMATRCSRLHPARLSPTSGASASRCSTGARGSMVALRNPRWRAFAPAPSCQWKCGSPRTIMATPLALIHCCPRTKQPTPSAEEQFALNRDVRRAGAKRARPSSA